MLKTLNCTVAKSVKTGNPFFFSPQVRRTKVHIYFLLCDHSASHPRFTAGFKQEGGAARVSVKHRAITRSFTDSGFVVSHPMTVR